MILGSRLAPGGVRAWALVLLTMGAGCRSSAESAHLGLTPPAGWRPSSTSGVNVPGTPVAAWTGPRGATLVVFTALPIPRGTAKATAEDLSNRLTHLPGLQVLEHRTERWDGHEAARV